jgi:hypothetical protein
MGFNSGFKGLKYVLIRDEGKYTNSDGIFYSKESKAHTTDLYMSMTSLKIIMIFGSISKESAISKHEL